MSEPPIPNPKARICAARNLLMFGLCISDIIMHDKFDIGLLQKVRRFQNIEFIPTWDARTLLAQPKNLNMCVLGNCFLAVDEALEDVFGRKPSTFADTDLDSLRAIVYMLRCAIAHGTTAPRWNAQGQFRRVFRINEIGYEFDARNIHNKLIQHKDYGRLKGALSLIDYAEKLIDRHNKSA